MRFGQVVASVVCGVWCVAYIGSFSGTAPIWDGFWYARSIAEMPGRWSEGAGLGDGLRALAFWDHPTIAYALLQLPAQLLAPGFRSILVTNGLLAAAGVAFFLAAVRRCVPRAEGPQLLAAGLLLATNPILCSSALHVNVDFSVAVALCAALYAYVSNRPVLLGAAGLLMVFSKETGALLYGAILGALALVAVLRSADPARIGTSPTLGGQLKIEDLPRRIGWLVPLFLLLVFLWHNHFRGVPVVWGHQVDHDQPLWVQVVGGFSAGPGVLVTRMLQIFVLSYQWVGLLLLMVVVASRPHSVGVLSRADGIVFGLVFVGFAVPTLAYDTFVNPRYVLPAIVLLSFVVCVLCLARFERRSVSVGLLAALVALQLLELGRTSDPVSRWLFGTFEVGERRMLHMTSLSRDCCGPYGRDQLVYNAQFAAISRLLERAFEEMNLDADTALLVPPEARGRLLETSWEPVLRLRDEARDGGPPPVLTDRREVVAFLDDRPERRVVFVAMPWFGPVEEQSRRLARDFELGTAVEVRERGHALLFFEIRTRDGETLPFAGGGGPGGL